MEPNFSSLSSALGVEVDGIDLSRQLDRETVAELREAFSQHHLLLLRNQEI
ncbi:MAG: taurine dioxygenase, partial [Rhodospirillaceae bacterium]|nr:taurine dioxygenase [Rhodospirillaceae bacterium]